jgi:hypothetical protein
VAARAPDHPARSAGAGQGRAVQALGSAAPPHRILKTRAETWQQADEHGRKLNRTKGIAHLGGATLDNEENYLIKKLFTALGAIQIENQARI